MKLLSSGNRKIKCLSFSLPVNKCCEVICKGCYSLKAERQYPNVRTKRQFNYEESLKDTFVDIINQDIAKAKKSKTKIINTSICRINTDGDFYSQEYINKWCKIVKENPNIKFYCYTKTLDKFDFSKIKKWKNFNIINSLTAIGYNYGDEEYCNMLVEKYKYYLCPCAPGINIKCQVDCNYCAIRGNNKICFLKH